jgi:hypothetical protein
VREGSNVIISVYRYTAPATSTDTTPVTPDTTPQGQNQNP